MTYLLPDPLRVCSPNPLAALDETTQLCLAVLRDTGRIIGHSQQLCADGIQECSATRDRCAQTRGFLDRQGPLLDLEQNETPPLAVVRFPSPSDPGPLRQQRRLDRLHVVAGGAEGRQEASNPRSVNSAAVVVMVCNPGRVPPRDPSSGHRNRLEEVLAAMVRDGVLKAVRTRSGATVYHRGPRFEEVHQQEVRSG
jgi:hypothetical protein